MSDPLTRMVAQLKATVNVTAIVAQKVFPVFAPEDQDWPYIVYSQTSDVPLNTAGGSTTTRETRIELNLIAAGTPAGYGQVRALAAAVAGALSGWHDGSGSIWHLDNSSDNPGALATGQGVLDFHRVSQDYTVWYAAE